MRVLVLHETPEADAVAAQFEGAAEEFNRGLDIRLRFLDVGFNLRKLPVSAEDPRAPVALEAALERHRPEVLLVLGGGARLLECVAAGVKARARVVFLADNESDRTTDAIARMADLLLVPRSRPERATVAGDRAHLLTSDGSVGPEMVEVLVRLRRTP